MRRAGNWLNLTIFLGSIVAILVVVNIFAGRDSFRLRLDATKTRAYSLSEQTRKTLSELEGRWTIAMLVVEKETDAAVLRQVDEVLMRFQESASNLEVQRIDPTDPSTLGEYERLLNDLQLIYADLIDEYDEAIDMGSEAFAALWLYAQQRSAMMESLLGRLPTDLPQMDQLTQRLKLLSLLAENGGLVLAEVDKNRFVSESRPIPDYEAARSILAEALSRWADELFFLARMYDEWLQADSLDPGVRKFATDARGECDQLAQRLAQAADPLKRLKPLELASIGRQIQSGRAAIVVGPDRATAIPASQLFPRVNLRQNVEGIVRFDQRFRGEQIIAAAIRSVMTPHMPLVVFVQNEEQTLLKRRENLVDLVGAATMLNAARYEVVEWIVSESDRPVPAHGQPAAWIIVPPVVQSLTPSTRERDLIRAVEDLIDDGNNVLLSFNPSLLHSYGQSNPWQTVMSPFGLVVDTSQVIFQRPRDANDTTPIEKGQLIRETLHDHPIAQALNGQDSFFPFPMMIKPAEHVAASVTHWAIASVNPKTTRWLEDKWMVKDNRRGAPTEDKTLTEPANIVMAAERHDPAIGSRQRLIAVGSGPWMLTQLADATVPIGGQRMALQHPGNHELLQASVAWLAHMDDLIAPGPISQQVARLDGVTDRVQLMWAGFAVIGAPGLFLLLGIGVWFMRRY